MIKWSRIILIPYLLVLVGCSRINNPPVSGTITINNVTTLGQTYFVYGFLFSKADLVSTLNTPPPDITVGTDGVSLFLESNNLRESFYKVGDYGDATQASEAFKNLKSAAVSPWAGLATPLIENQVWIYRSGSDNFAKLRIISTKGGTVSGRDYAECTFEWVYQPDGTSTFPGK